MSGMAGRTGAEGGVEADAPGAATLCERCSPGAGKDYAGARDGGSRGLPQAARAAGSWPEMSRPQLKVGLAVVPGVRMIRPAFRVSAAASWSPRWASSTRSWSWPMTSAVALPGVDERLRRPAERGQPALPLGDAPGAPGMPRTGCAEHAGYSGVPGMPRTGCAEHAGYAGAPGMPRTGCAEHAGYAGAPGMPRTGDTGDTGSGGCAARSRSGADVEHLSSRCRAGMEPPDAVCWRRTDMGATATTGVTTGDGCARAEHGDRSHRGPASRRWLRTP